MTTKQVSVRLSATGGRQVRAKLEGVGEAGSRGFGQLTREMEAANRRMEAFWRRAGDAAAAATAALAAAAGAMIRFGLQVVDAQTKLAASLDTSVASIQILERAGDLAGVSMGQIEQATMQLTRRLSQAASGTGPATDALRRLGLSAGELQALPLDQRIALIQDRLADLVPEAERAAMRRALRLARRLAARPELDLWRGEEALPGPGCDDSDAALDAFIATAASTHHHPAGTCRMGTDAGAVVDARLCVHGVDNLFVVDASIILTLTSRPINAAVVAIAETWVAECASVMRR